MPTPAEQALDKARTRASERGKVLLDGVAAQTAAFADRMRGQKPLLAPSDILVYKPVSPLLGARLNDNDFLNRIGGAELVEGLKRLKPEHTSTVGFPGFELHSWPHTLGQLYAVCLTNNRPGTTRSVYGFDEEGERFINDNIGRHMEGNLLNPDFRSDTLAMEVFLSLLQEYEIPLLVAVGGLEILSARELTDLDAETIRVRLMQQMINVASQQRTPPAMLSPFDRNEQMMERWVSSLGRLRHDVISTLEQRKSV